MLNVNDKVLVKNNFGNEFEGKVVDLDNRYATIEMAIHNRKDKTDKPITVTCKFLLKSQKCSNYDRNSVVNSSYFLSK